MKEGSKAPVGFHSSGIDGLARAMKIMRNSILALGFDSI
jgi:hypothetical protein